ncbi:hypothetical protein HK096_008193, partial [Nowakowskiella sp. JEL0078]
MLRYSKRYKEIQVTQANSKWEEDLTNVGMLLETEQTVETHSRCKQSDTKEFGPPPTINASVSDSNLILIPRDSLQVSAKKQKSRRVTFSEHSDPTDVEMVNFDS